MSSGPRWGSRSRRQGRREARRKAGRAALRAVPAVAGTGAGAASASVVGPGSGLVGMGASSTVRKLLNWTHLDRLFANARERFERRQGERAESAFRKAIEVLADALDDGRAIRDDGFFGRDGDTPSDAEQILEGVLRSAAESHEARKAERMGELYAYFALHVDVSAAHANFLLGLADRLTYQQLLLLGLLIEDEKRPRDVPDFVPTGLFTHAEVGILFELHDLAREGLLIRDDNRLITSFGDVNPARLRTVLNGRILVEAMNLREAKPEDWDGIKWAFARLGKLDTGQAVDGRVSAEAVVIPGSPEGDSRVKMDKQVVEFQDPVVHLEDLPEP